MNNIIQFSNLSKFPQIFHCFSTKPSGNLKPQKNNSNFEIIFNNEQTNFFTSQKIQIKRTVFMEQVHGAEVASCDHDCAGHWVPGVDGLVTTGKYLFLCVNTADCVPLFFYEPINQIIGIAHAGWRGTLGEIANKVLQRMIDKHGGKLENILVGIGPAICGKCYEVDKERYELFDSIRHCEPHEAGRSNLLKNRLLRLPINRDPRNDKKHLDLKEINAKILIGAGIKPENIEISSYCTSCNNDKFYSYRKDGKGKYGEMIGIIGIIG